jgi:hypothetical protein
MSLSWRERVRAMGYKRFDCTQEEWNLFMQHIGDACRISDQHIRSELGENAPEKQIDDCMDHMTDNDFIQFTNEVLDEFLVKFGIRKKRKNAKKVASRDYDPDTEYLAEQYGQEIIEKAKAEQKAINH